MSNSEKAEDLRIVERNPGYDKANNPQRLSIAELMPVGLTWNSDCIQHAIHNLAGVSGRLLGDASGIAVVEAPYDLSANRAYIVNAKGRLRAQIPAQIGSEHVVFYDVMETEGLVAFLAVASGRDIQIEVREADGVVVRIAQSR